MRRPNDPYRRMARLMASQQMATGASMRDLLKVRGVNLRMAAAANGWRRDPVAFIRAGGGPPSIRWKHTGGMVYVSDDPEALPQPLREAVRATLIGFFSRTCPVCGAEARWLTEGQLEASDLGRVWGARFRFASVLDEGALEEAYSALGIEPGFDVFAIEHEPECPVRPEHIGLLDGDAAN
jgi:hypothetical protein